MRQVGAPAVGNGGELRRGQAREARGAGSGCRLRVQEPKNPNAQGAARRAAGVARQASSSWRPACTVAVPARSPLRGGAAPGLHRQIPRGVVTKQMDAKHRRRTTKGVTPQNAGRLAWKKSPQRTSLRPPKGAGRPRIARVICSSSCRQAGWGSRRRRVGWRVQAAPGQPRARVRRAAGRGVDGEGGSRDGQQQQQQQPRRRPLGDLRLRRRQTAAAAEAPVAAAEPTWSRRQQEQEQQQQQHRTSKNSADTMLISSTIKTYKGAQGWRAGRRRARSKTAWGRLPRRLPPLVDLPSAGVAAGGERSPISRPPLPPPLSLRTPAVRAGAPCSPSSNLPEVVGVARRAWRGRRRGVGGREGGEGRASLRSGAAASRSPSSRHKGPLNAATPHQPSSCTPASPSDALLASCTQA